MNKDILKISIRNQAIYIPSEQICKETGVINETTTNLIVNAKKLGIAFSEDLLRALNGARPTHKSEVLEVLNEILGTDKNWTPLVKGWDTPTGESVIDHIITLLANIFKIEGGTTLPCGHLIPDNTFPLERYNGCPFCGTPFEFGKLENYGQGSKLKVMELWTDADVLEFYKSLLSSKTALDASQVNSLKTLLAICPVPDTVQIGMKETTMLLIDSLIENGKFDEVMSFFKSPADILRYLWYKHTGFLQIYEPKTLAIRISRNSRHFHKSLDTSAEKLLAAKHKLKLKYTRKECIRYAIWLNKLDMDVEKCCEIMHPKRGMWVRIIRALRLAEYSKRKGFEKLALLLDTFYKQEYPVFQGKVDYFRLKQDAENTFALLKKRPGLFARSLFANILWFGPEITLHHFREIVDQVPARLLLTLVMYSNYYFTKEGNRTVKPLGGTGKVIPVNKLINLYNEKQLADMRSGIEELGILVIKNRFKSAENKNKTIYIEESLNFMPLPIGDRSESVQDLPCALMGTRFIPEGNIIRLFMQWGVGLKAQHMDMDLSCIIAFNDRTEFCSYYYLVATGCKHSGDIRYIPDKVGTAEYIEIDIDELQSKGAKYVSFTCNAYSAGSLTPGLVVGWMNSRYPMKISEKTGVAYDPSCVQHQVKITQNLSKGLVFGVLDVEKKEIIWLEMSFGGQIVQNLNFSGVKALINKLSSKLNIGHLLSLKAEAQQLSIVTNKEEADEVYDYKWAINSAAVTQLFVG